MLTLPCLGAILAILLQVLAPISSTEEVEKRGHHKIHHYKHLLKMAEIYEKAQKEERYQPSHTMHKVNPAFPCFFGVIPIGVPESNDGHKYACGVFDISHSPIVYSLGSNQQQEFEAALLHLRPDAKIFTFEINHRRMVPKNLRFSQVQYYNIGIGYDKNNKIFKSLKECMKMLGHTYIDILKMDIEGGEYPFIDNEFDLIPRVGQLLIEMHSPHPVIPKALHPRNGDYIPYIVKLEEQGLGLFYKEQNVLSDGIASEYSFIQKDWASWEANKLNFGPLE